MPHVGRTRSLAICAFATLLSLVGLSSATGCRSGHAASEAGDAAGDATGRARYEETRETITRLAQDLMRANEVTGVSLALIDGDEVVWATGFGMADVDRKLPAGPRTVYDVGSLAKPITVAAILQAVERGDLELDDTLAERIPELELADHAERRITVEHLLTHQSGLPSDWFIHSLSEQPPPWQDIAQEIRGVELAAEPGELTIYSNLGMTLAGLALERASGRAYEQLVTETLLRPAGMRTAYFAAGPEPEPVLLPTHDGPKGLAAIDRAASYRTRQARFGPEFRMAPAGGLHASVLDLAAFARLVLAEGRVGGEQLLAPASVEAMLSPHNDALALDLDHSFGYAWFLDHSELDWVGRVASHGGRTYYHHAKLIVLPDQGLAVAVASNSLTAGRVVESLAVETLLSALLEKHGLLAPEPPAIVEVEYDPTEPASPELTQQFLDAHAGDYATSIGVSTIGARPSTQPLEVWSQAKVGSSRLSIDGPDGGTVDVMPGARVRFLDEGGEHLMVVQRGDTLRRTGVRLDPPQPIPEAWQARVGRWTLIEREGEVSTIREPALRVVDGRLTLEFLGLLEYPPIPVVMVLEPLDDRRARIQGLARGQGVIVEIRSGESAGESDGESEHLWWAGREFRRDRPTDTPPAG